MTRSRFPLSRRAGRTSPLVLGAEFLTILGLTACAATQTAAPADGQLPTPLPHSALAPYPTASPSPVPTSVPDAADCPGVASYRPMTPMPIAGSMPRGTTMAAIQQRGHLIVGVDQDEYQVGYRNLAPFAPTGEEYKGFDIDLLHAVAQAVFGGTDGAQRIEFVPVGQGYSLGAADQGVVDVVADSVTMTCAPQDQVRFSVDYLDSSEQLLVRSSDKTVVNATLGRDRVPQITGLAGDRVCTVGTQASVQEIVALQRGGKFRVVIAGNWSDCLVLLQQGAVRALAGSSTILAGLQAEDPYLAVVGDPLSYEPHGLAFPVSDPSSPGNAQFASFVNGVIARLESGDGGYCPQPRAASDPSCWAALFRRWLEPQLALPAPPRPVYLP
jgi:polar amino acid transport system substrate-binding protein